MHEVLISYSTKDRLWADAACAALEARGIRCWIAPRDIIPGTEWGAAIIAGIDACKVVVLIFSASANASPQVRREVERAISKGLIIVPCRIENVMPVGAMEFALGNTHWLDVFTPPVERQMNRLAESVAALLARDGRASPLVAGGPASVSSDSTRGTQRFEESGNSKWNKMGRQRLIAVAGIVLCLLIGASLVVVWPRKNAASVPGNAALVAQNVNNAAAISGPSTSPTAIQDGFVPLFNGEDMAGWKTQPECAEGWRVEKGVLMWTRPTSSFLWTERGDYRDFHLRVETRIGDGTFANLIVRDTFSESGDSPYKMGDSPYKNGYRIILNSTNPNRNKTGSLGTGRGGPPIFGSRSPPRPNEWFTLEVIAEGKRIVVKVNGQTTVDYRDPEPLFARGHITLFAVSGPSDEQIGFRKIEIKELPRR
jgi:Domain of Unknown Function (DUF1080)/TIR domain